MKKLLSAFAFYVFFFSRTYAQVVLDSEDIDSGEIFETSYNSADLYSSFFVWALFASSIIFFLIFWFNRNYLWSVLTGKKERLELDILDQQLSVSKMQNKTASEKINQEADKNSKKDFERSETETIYADSTIHDLNPEISEQDYKKPKLKIVISDSGPKLVFD